METNFLDRKFEEIGKFRKIRRFGDFEVFLSKYWTISLSVCVAESTMGLASFIKAFLARALFAIHGIIAIWRVTDVNSERIYYLLIIPVCLLPLEMILAVTMNL